MVPLFLFFFTSGITIGNSEILFLYNVYIYSLITFTYKVLFILCCMAFLYSNLIECAKKALSYNKN